MEVVMERQKTRFPELQVPHVIIILIDLIKHLNGNLCPYLSLSYVMV
jgi:hypothetical protein